MRKILDYPFWSVFADTLAIFFIAIFLVGIHFLVPAAVRELFVFHYPMPSLMDALTAAYIHISFQHLFGNVTGYLLGSSIVYLLCIYSGERRWFRFTILVFLTLLPILVNMTGAAVIDAPVKGRGFSGIVAGFAGFILVTTPVVLHRNFDVEWRDGMLALAGMIFIIGGELAWSIKDGLPLVLYVLLLVGILLVSGGAVRAHIESGLTPISQDEWRRLIAAIVIVLGNLAIVSWFVVNLFPGDLAANGSTTNILSHYTGFVYGAVLSGWGYRYWSTDGEDQTNEFDSTN